LDLTPTALLHAIPISLAASYFVSHRTLVAIFSNQQVGFAPFLRALLSIFHLLPCQKSPSQKTTNRTFRNTKSGRPGRSWRRAVGTELAAFEVHFLSESHVVGRGWDPAHYFGRDRGSRL